MSIKLTKAIFGHSIGDIVRDVGYDTERRLVDLTYATYDLTGGIEQSNKTVPNGLTREEQKLDESAIALTDDGKVQTLLTP